MIDYDKKEFEFKQQMEMLRILLDNHLITSQEYYQAIIVFLNKYGIKYAK